MYPEFTGGSERHGVVPVASALTLAVAMLSPSVAKAEWSGGLSGGAVIRDGAQSNRIRLSLSNDTRPLSHHIYADWIQSRGEDSYELGYRPRYWVTEKLYGLVDLSFRTDPVININRETTEAIGVGYQFLGNSQQSAVAEVAVGARQITFSAPGLEDLSQPFARLRGNYTHVLTDIARFRLDLATIVSEDVQETSAEVGATVDFGTFAVNVGYRIIEQRIEGLPTISDDTVTLSFSYGL